MTREQAAFIYVIEDEEDLAELARFNLTAEGFRVVTKRSAEEGLTSLEKETPDLILLDLMLPKMDGLEFCRLIRSQPKTRNIPVVMITAKGEERDIVKGLESGADDYIPKPFSPKVLTARVKAVLRRAMGDKKFRKDEIVRIHDLVIHPGRFEVLVGEERVVLTNTEFQILHLLSQRPGWVFTRSQIVDAVKGDNHAVTDRSVDVQIVGLRRKLGNAGEYIETVRGVGYRFKE